MNVECANIIIVYYTYWFIQCLKYEATSTAIYERHLDDPTKVSNNQHYKN